MSTVMVSPGLIEFFVQPARSNTLGARPSTDQSTFLPLPSSMVSVTQVCGFAHRKLLDDARDGDDLGDLKRYIAVVRVRLARMEKRHPKHHSKRDRA